REVNRRLQAMLVQQGADPVASQWDWATERGPASARADPMAATWPAKVRSSVSVGFLPEPPGTAPVSMRRSSAAFSDSSDLASEDGLHFSRSPSGPGRPASREGAVTARSSLAPRASAMALRPRRSSLTAAVRHRATLGGEQQVSRLSRMLSCFGFFWRDLEAPSAILQALADVVFRTATDRHMVVTVFVVDPWLRSSLDEEGQGDRQMPVFYLGQGKVELTAIPQSSSGKAEAPRFADLSALPYRSRAALAAPVPRAGASAGRPLAVVQISGDRDFERQLSVRRRSSRTPPPVEQRDSNSSHVGNQQSISSHISHRSSIHDAPGGAAYDSIPGDSCSPAGSAIPTRCGSARFPGIGRGQQEPGAFCDHHAGWLALACNVAGGLLAQADRLHRRSEMCSRMKDCLEMAVNLNKAKSIRDFEQRMKHLFGFFFDVGFVRLLYYDEGSRRLSSCLRQQKSKEPKPQSMDKGIVGHCARTRQFQHVAVMARHQYLEPGADGLHRVGRTINSQGSMLCGPLVTDSDQSRAGGPQFLGVVQIMDRRAQNLLSREAKSGKRKDVGDFSSEEADVFQQLLRTCAQALLRVLVMEKELLEKTMPGELPTLPRVLSL
ncbi:unnamed protein product, partial [Prorocentrum cordatum]